MCVQSTWIFKRIFQCRNQVEEEAKTRHLPDITPAGDSEEQELSLIKDQSRKHWESQFADPQGSMVLQMSLCNIPVKCMTSQLKGALSLVTRKCCASGNTSGRHRESQYNQFRCVPLVCLESAVRCECWLYSQTDGVALSLLTAGLINYILPAHIQEDDDGKVTITLMSKIPRFPSSVQSRCPSYHECHLASCVSPGCEQMCDYKLWISPAPRWVVGSSL